MKMPKRIKNDAVGVSAAAKIKERNMLKKQRIAVIFCTVVLCLLIIALCVVLCLADIYPFEDINGDKYTRSGQYIEIKVSVTPDGRIISCKTTAQKESEGIGDACAKPEFYTKFNGKEQSTLDQVDAIAGATITTNGYKSAVASAFEAVKILEGGAQ